MPRKPPRDMQEVLAEVRAGMGQIVGAEPDVMVHEGPHSYMISAKEARARESAQQNAAQALRDLRVHFQNKQGELEQAQEKIRTLEAWVKKALGTGLLTIDPECKCRTCQDVKDLLAEAGPVR
jgi:hypothetical protein